MSKHTRDLEHAKIAPSARMGIWELQTRNGQTRKTSPVEAPVLQHAVPVHNAKQLFATGPYSMLPLFTSVSGHLHLTSSSMTEHDGFVPNYGISTNLPSIPERSHVTHSTVSNTHSEYAMSYFDSTIDKVTTDVDVRHAATGVVGSVIVALRISSSLQPLDSALAIVVVTIETILAEGHLRDTEGRVNAADTSSTFLFFHAFRGRSHDMHTVFTRHTQLTRRVNQRSIRRDRTRISRRDSFSVAHVAMLQPTEIDLLPGVLNLRYLDHFVLKVPELVVLA